MTYKAIKALVSTKLATETMLTVAEAINVCMTKANNKTELLAELKELRIFYTTQAEYTAHSKVHATVKANLTEHYYFRAQSLVNAYRMLVFKA